MRSVISSFLEKSEKIFTIALMALVALGILFRSRHYLACRSLWLDEAMLALDVLQLSFWELTQQPLPYQQGAPIGFLFFVKVTTLLLGDSEYAFRLYSLLASFAALFLMAFLAKRYLNKAGILFSVALFASSPYLIYYSAETKQYMGDVAATLLLLFLLNRQLDKAFSRREIIIFSLVNIIILWFSHSAVFVVASVGIVLALHYARQQDKEALSFALLNLALSGISASLLYWFHLRPLSASNFLRSFWEEAFLPVPPNFHWFKELWEGILQNPLGLDALPVVFLLLFLGGIVFLWRIKWQFALALLLTMLFTFAAGALQKYPLAERMLLFSTPIFFLLFGAGLDAFYSLIRYRTSRNKPQMNTDKRDKNLKNQRSSHSSVVNFSDQTQTTTFRYERCTAKNSLKLKTLSFGITLLLAAYLLYFPFHESFSKLKNPLYREDIRSSMAYLKDHLREDDLIYVYYYTEPAFLFYLPKYHLENSSYLLGSNHQEQPNAYLQEIDELEGRVWFIFTHVHENASINEEDFIVNYLNQKAEKDREYRVPGTSVSLYLYELR